MDGQRGARGRPVPEAVEVGLENDSDLAQIQDRRTEDLRVGERKLKKRPAIPTDVHQVRSGPLDKMSISLSKFKVFLQTINFVRN